MQDQAGFSRRKPDRLLKPGGGSGGGGRRAFFKTVSGPEETPYPPAADAPTVYYARRLTNPRFLEEVGAQPIQYEETDEFEFVFNLESSTYIEEGAVVLGFLENGRWWTIDKVPPSVTHRSLVLTSASGFTKLRDPPELWSADYLLDQIQPDGPGRLTSAGGLQTAGEHPTWIASTRLGVVTVRPFSVPDGKPVRVQTGLGAGPAVTFDHGGDVLSMIAGRTTSEFPRRLLLDVGGAPGHDGATFRVVRFTQPGQIDLSESETLFADDSLAAVHGLALFGTTQPTTYTWLAVGERREGGGTVAQYFADNSLAPQNPPATTIDPVPSPSAVGTAAAWLSGGFFVGSARWLAAFRGTGGGPNAFEISGGGVQRELSALSGSDLLACATVSLGQSDQRVIVAGVGDGEHTIEAFQWTANSLPGGGWGTTAWRFDTGATVRGLLTRGGGGSFPATVIAVGDRNADGETLWILDAATGELLDTYDHGAPLRAIAPVHPSIPGGGDFTVAGDRAPLHR